MSLSSWFSGLFDNNLTVSIDGIYGELVSEYFYKELAVQSCVNLIANAVSRGEFLTYENGKKVRKDNYYVFNVEPNQNKSASKFWRDVVHKLVYKNECLVVQIDGKLFAVDDFTVDEYALKENLYRSIVIGNYTLGDSLTESKVLHFELHNDKINTIIDGLYMSYSKMIAASQLQYKKNNARRGTLDIPVNYPQTEKAQKDIEDLLKNKFKRFFDADGGAVLPLSNGMKYEELSSNIGVKGGAEGRDIKAFIDDVFGFVAIGFQIPPQLLLGNVADTDKAVNNFLTFCINPLSELINDEINRKMYGKKLFLNNTYVKHDTSRIKAVDIKDIANALDVLVRIGAYTIDDCLLQLGMEPLNTEESRARFMTKNYAPVTDVINSTVEGGDISNGNS